MKCLNCGRDTTTPLCDSCSSVEVLDNVFNSILFYNPEKCPYPNVIAFVSSCSEKYEERSILPSLLDQFDSGVSEYYYCILYRKSRHACFEEYAVRYIEGHSFEHLKTQRILYELLDSYLRNDFIKPQKWCAKIGAVSGLCGELYRIAAEHCAMIGDYDRAETLVELGLSLCADESYNQFLFGSREGMVIQLHRLQETITRYRTVKPYWPTTEERRRAVAMFYDERGIKYPRIENKPERVPEDQFEPIKESMAVPSNDYCVFWCAAAFGVAAAKSIYQIAAVKIRNGSIAEEFQSFVRPWDGAAVKKAAAKEAGVSLDVIEGADDVDLVLKRFFEFVGDDVLISTDAFGTQAKFISRAARYAGMKRIDNEFLDLLDLAADIDSKFDLQNNSRTYLLQNFEIEEGSDSLGKAKANYLLFNALSCHGE